MNNGEIYELMNPLSLPRLWVLISRLMRFAIVGFSGVFIDLGGFYFLHGLLGLSLITGAMISTELAIINNFIWNDRWTFGDVSTPKNLVTQKLQRFAKFNLICLVGMLVNVAIVNFLVNKFTMNEYMAKLVAIICVTFWNFGINLRWNWQIK
ncbi:GtrA family protein [Calothrix sp. FACHB-1219]|uniref:GtrA family protein n=1 Tax=unclassified Calothrix TaxID=2619626 RepID=UPI0016830BF5|nr:MULTISPECIES: GtrA family protein [unclassified Calothrix]MBD2202771.1 GtrA family protein [Calothrix sp. FACHB-168]MBD2218924.1 GtrA family protein [Calothrix sp. FACHB-1219]